MPRPAEIAADPGAFGILTVLAGGFNIITLLLRDYLLLVGWAVLVEIWASQ